jgi:hypothetical protein
VTPTLVSFEEGGWWLLVPGCGGEVSKFRKRKDYFLSGLYSFGRNSAQTWGSCTRCDRTDWLAAAPGSSLANTTGSEGSPAWRSVVGASGCDGLGSSRLRQHALAKGGG